MPLVDITIAGRRHQVQCGEGEQTRLRRLAAYVDGKAAELSQSNPQLTEARLLLLASLTVADELLDSYEELKRLRDHGQRERQDQEAAEARAMEDIATRLERLAEALEKT
jgi:cell division protein ZapA